ncbi:hypothetical protein FRB90_011684 [Tulasnella sp. 427]|nr:hypothetical protein FRB90_011684 [Tulasnella sp. 427]
MEVENNEDFLRKDEEDLFDDDFEETDEDAADNNVEADERELLREEREERSIRISMILKKRAKPVIAVETQDVSIREALELEERNVASLANLLKKEEEKKRQARVTRTNIGPPVVRWISRIEETDTQDEQTSVSESNEEIGTNEAHQSRPMTPVNEAPPTRGSTRNYVVLEVARGSNRKRYKMSDTEAFLNGHEEWSRDTAIEQEQVRARAQLLKDPTCAITGLKAKYLEPRSGVPYADVRGYKVLSKVLRHEYVWAQEMGCYTHDECDEGAKGLPSEWSWANQKGGKMKPPRAQRPFTSQNSNLATRSPSQA